MLLQHNSQNALFQNNSALTVVLNELCAVISYFTQTYEQEDHDYFHHLDSFCIILY